MRLVATGCSVTHGAEIEHPFMSKNNIEFSYPAILARRLNLELTNVALSGGSNDYIFHSAVEQLEQLNDIEVLLVCWTHSPRLTWQAFGKTYILHPTFATALSDVYQDPKYKKEKNGLTVTSDENIIDQLEQGIKFAVTHMIDCDELERKRSHHSIGLEAICKQRQIKFIELDVMDFKNVGTYDQEGRHPNVVEHGMIADLIHSKYFIDSN